MYRLENPEILYALFSLPVIWMLYFLYRNWRLKKLNEFSDLALIDSNIPNKATYKLLLKSILMSLAFTCFILGLANPQIGSKLEEVKREGIDIMIALDLSNSMLAEDLKPNRLEKSKRAISKLVERLHSDRIGIVVFGGEAYTQLPLTSDLSAAKLFLRNVSTDIIPTQGTNIGAAIKRCVKSFDQQSAAGKAIIIITDGENHEENAVEEARLAAEVEIQIYTVGMATTQGVPIPLFQNDRKMGYRKDREGNSVVTKLNESMLKELAAEGNGFYIRATSSDAGLNQILDELEQLDKAEIGTKLFTDYEDRFQYFVALGLLFLILEFFVTERKNKFISNLKLFEAKSKV
jgi:Ca-activated chloride channel family protein